LPRPSEHARKGGSCRPAPYPVTRARPADHRPADKATRRLKFWELPCSQMCQTCQGNFDTVNHNRKSQCCSFFFIMY
ncbi:unnamed protein product, partial [Ixodes pacificus]